MRYSLMNRHHRLMVDRYPRLDDQSKDVGFGDDADRDLPDNRQPLTIFQHTLGRCAPYHR